MLRSKYRDNLTLEIFKQAGDAIESEIDFNNIENIRVSKEEHFVFNNFFSMYVKENAAKTKYLISPTLTRCEAQTGLLDKVMKYLFILESIEKSPSNVKIVNLDYIVFRALLHFAAKSGLRFKYSYKKRVLTELSYWPAFPYRLMKLFFNKVRLLIVARKRLKKVQGGNYKYGLFSFYDDRTNDHGVHRDAFFAPLINYLAVKRKSTVVFHSFLGRQNRYEKYIADIAGMSRNVEVSVIDRVLTLSDLMRTVIRGLVSRIKLRDPIVFRGKDITYLTNLSLRNDYLRRANWFFAYRQYYFFKRLLTQYHIDEILYPYENHPWEKMCILARNECSPTTRLVAFQHTSVSFKLLNHFPGVHEKDLPIFPDKIVTVGKILRDVLESRGHFPEGRVTDGCALRHGYLFEDKTGWEREPSRETAFAFSSDIKTYRAIIDNLIKVFEGTEYIVYLKIHPLIEERAAIHRPLPVNFIPAKMTPWPDLFKKICFLMYDDNSLGIEALRYNVPVVYFPLNGQVYDCDRLFNYRGKKIRAISVEQFRRDVAEKGDLLRFSEADIEYNQRYLHEYFAPITEKRLNRFLD